MFLRGETPLWNTPLRLGLPCLYPGEARLFLAVVRVMSSGGVPAPVTLQLYPNPMFSFRCCFLFSCCVKKLALFFVLVSFTRFDFMPICSLLGSLTSGLLLQVCEGQRTQRTGRTLWAFRWAFSMTTSDKGWPWKAPSPRDVYSQSTRLYIHEALLSLGVRRSTLCFWG